MYSFRFLTTLSVFLGLCILVVEIRPSYSMPIEGDKNSDKYQGIFDLIAQRLRNLSEVNREDDDQNIRKSYLPLTTLGNIMNRTSVSQNTTNVNNTAGLRGTTQKHQINSQNSRRSYVPTGISFTRNFLAGNPPAANQMAGRSPGGNQLVGNFPARNLSVENQLSGNFPARNPAAKNELTANFSVGIRQAVTFPNVTKPASYSLANREQTGASMFPASLNDGPTSHEDRSGLYTNFYRQPLTYDRKDTIYRQNVPVSNQYSQGNVNVYGTIASSSDEARRGGFISPYQYTQSYQNYQQSMGHRIPNYQEYSSYSGYPSNQQQQWRRGYSAGPGYQLSYPGISQQYKDPRERVPMDKKWSVPVTVKESENHINNKHDDTPLPMLSTIQSKLPEKPVKKSKSPRIQSLPADSITSSGSGSGLDDSENMSDESDNTNITDDIQESKEFSGSGSGDNDEDLNGDTSNVAFMLAGTHNDPIKPPSFPVPGLPMKLTRKQALDIYKSALYFAGLLREDNLNNDKAGSGNDVIDDEDREDTKIDDEDDDDDVNDDNDVTITDNDVKEALAASSGELPASGQPISDTEASGSQSEPPVTQSQSKDNDTIIKGESEGQNTASNFSKLVSEPLKEAVQAPPPDNSAQKIEEESPKDEEEDADKEQSNTEQGENVEDINAETPPPPDSDKQTTDSTVQDDDTPPPDETRQMKEAQTKYSEDQQEEKALSYLANARQRGVYSSPSQRTVICKDTTQKISCPPQQRIRILNADYGDTGDVGCLKAANPMPAGMCRTPGAYETVKRQCDGLEDCDLFASNGVFGDACPDANKYLDVNYDCVNNPAHKKFEPPRPPPQQEEKSSPGLQPIIQLPQFIFQVPYPAAPAPGYSQASYQSSSQYVNPPPPPVAYAPAPYQAPPPAAYAPAIALPNLLPPSPYVAPDPCNPCNTCAQCSLPVCSPCTQTCHALTCPPRIPAKLQPLWQQWNERTADMSRMEMAALIISPLPKLAAPTKAPETTEASGAAEGSESESGDETTDEDALYEASKRSGIQRVKSQPKSTKTTLTAHKKAHDKEESEQGFLRNSDLMVSSGDASSGSST